MSILDACGAVPSNFTVPLTVATVAGSIGVAAGAVPAGSDILLLDCSVFSFLLHAAVASKPHRASVATSILPPVFLFMMSPCLMGIENSARYCCFRYRADGTGNSTANRHSPSDAPQRPPVCGC